MKTEYGISLKKLTSGAFVDATNATEVGLIGMAVKNYEGYGFHFEGGAIFDARNKIVIVDEADKTVNFSFFRHLLTILANKLIDFRKGNIKYHEDNFNVSFIGFGNPIWTRFQGIPKVEIDQTFRRNKELLSRDALNLGS